MKGVQGEKKRLIWINCHRYDHICRNTLWDMDIDRYTYSEKAGKFRESQHTAVDVLSLKQNSQIRTWRMVWSHVWTWPIVTVSLQCSIVVDGFFFFFDRLPTACDYVISSMATSVRFNVWHSQRKGLGFTLEITDKCRKWYPYSLKYFKLDYWSINTISETQGHCVSILWIFTAECDWLHRFKNSY